MIKPPEKFIGNPEEQHEEAKKEIQKVERAEKRKEKKVLETPQPKWVETVYSIVFVLLAIYFLLDRTIPILKDMKDATINKAEIQFTKDNPEMVKAMRVYLEKKVAEDKASIVDAFQ
jgi:hypothetical protein